MSLKVYSRRKIMLRPKYDAEIEYLETMGNCVIHTTCVPSGSNIAISTKFMFNGYISASPYISWYSAYTSVDNQAFRVLRYTDDICVQNGSVGSRPASDPRFNVVSGNIYEIETNSRSVSVNGSVKTTRNLSSLSNTNPLNIFSVQFKGRCYYFQVHDNNIMILDCIPVRVGQIGYMYDRVSGQLFGNVGTGDFTLGPDI